jgi:tRNA (guanosine-2'-O-)-methyltransferase
MTAMPSDPVVARYEMRRLLTRRTSHDPDWFTFGNRTLSPSEVTVLLAPFATEERLAKIDAVLERRTSSLTVVVEGMVDTGNVAAVLRTADGFGVRDFHAIDTARSYKHSKRTSQGAEKWIDRYRWRSPAECVAYLHEAGFDIVAAHLDPEAAPVDQVDLTGKTALAFGNELDGVSDELLALSDQRAFIPITGFVQSFNISVAAALCLYEARRQRAATAGGYGDLDPTDRERLRAVYLMKSVRHHRQILERLLGDET